MKRILPCLDCRRIRVTSGGYCAACRSTRRRTDGGTDQDADTYAYDVDVLDVGVPRGQGESWHDLARRLRTEETGDVDE